MAGTVPPVHSPWTRPPWRGRARRPPGYRSSHNQVDRTAPRLRLIGGCIGRGELKDEGGLRGRVIYCGSFAEDLPHGTDAISAAGAAGSLADLFSINNCPATNITAANAIAKIAVANWLTSFMVRLLPQYQSERRSGVLSSGVSRRLQRCSRREQSDQRQPNQTHDISHQPRASPDSTALTSRIEFPTMTGVVGSLEARRVAEGDRTSLW
jgi:hypothetical protein